MERPPRRRGGKTSPIDRCQWSAESCCQSASFAGCYDKLLALEYEDCYFEIATLADPVAEWLNATIAATNQRRNLAIYHVDQTFEVRSRLDVGDAFLRQLSVSDLQASVPGPGRINFVVVPGSLHVVTNDPGSPLGSVDGNTFFLHLWSLTLNEQGLNGTASIRGLRMSVPKLLQQGSGRRQFLPGAATFDNVTVELGLSSSALQTLQQWVDETAGGGATPVSGEIAFFDLQLRPQGTILLQDVMPLAFTPFPTGIGGRRTLVLDVGRFRLDPQ